MREPDTSGQSEFARPARRRIIFPCEHDRARSAEPRTTSQPIWLLRRVLGVGCVRCHTNGHTLEGAATPVSTAEGGAIGSAHGAPAHASLTLTVSMSLEIQLLRAALCRRAVQRIVCHVDLVCDG